MTSIATIRTTTLLALAGFTPVVALAQAPGVLNQLNGVQQRQELEQSAQQTVAPGDSAPELYPGEESDVGPQSVLEIKPRRQLFEAMIDSQFYHTDNVLLVDSAKYSTTVLVSTAQFALAPTPYDLWGGQFAPAVGYSQQWFDYGLGDNVSTPYFHDVNTLDFNAQTMFADLRWWTKPGLTAELGFNYLRLLSTSDYSSFYEEADPYAGLSATIADDKVSGTFAYQASYHMPNGTTYDIDPDFNERFDSLLSISCIVKLSQRFSVQPYGQYRYTHFFTDTSRNDQFGTFGLAAYYQVCRYCHVRAFLNYNLRRSDRADLAPNYEEFDAGAGVNVDIRF